MPAQISVLSRKVLLDGSNINWYSEPLFFGNGQRVEMILEVHGMTDGTTAALTFQGSAHPGQNANWTVITAGTPADPSALTDVGVARYVRNGTLYPYVRIGVGISAVASGLRAAEVSVNGVLFETGTS